jgi:protein-S-isoprenylcysteine O-methyltransferase Ste14
LIFTILVPGTVAVGIPYLLSQQFGKPIELGEARYIGLPFLLLGVLLYCTCAGLFLIKGKGTPAIWFTRGLRSVIGEEPQFLVIGSVYNWSRNPMYLGVVLTVFGQALLFDDISYHFYACALWIIFHVVVTQIEEPHLRRKFGTSYNEYCKRTPRWIGFSGGPVPS